MRKFFWICSIFSLPSLSLAASLDVSLELPEQTDTPKYRPPYVAVWIENFNQERAAELAVWYKVNAPKNKGIKWLPDLSHWWKTGGQGLRMPIDGVSGATRRPGTHQLHFDESAPQLQGLKPGKYYLAVEAAREKGKHDVGREQVLISFTWPPTKLEQRSTQGKSELGSVSLTIAP